MHGLMERREIHYQKSLKSIDTLSDHVPPFLGLRLVIESGITDTSVLSFVFGVPIRGYFYI